MNEAILIWLYLAVGDVIGVATVIAVFAFICYFFGFFVSGIVSAFGQSTSSYDADEVALFKKISGSWKLALIPCLVIFCLAAAYPSKDDIKWIIGGALVWNGVDAASDIEGIEKLPENAVNAMNHFLESTADENEPE